MICNNCGKEIEYRLFGSGEWYLHVTTDRVSCDLNAEPIMGHINRKLDAQQILAEMAARQPAKAEKLRQYNPDLVEGSFEGEL